MALSVSRAREESETCLEISGAGPATREKARTSGASGGANSITMAEGSLAGATTAQAPRRSRLGQRRTPLGRRLGLRRRRRHQGHLPPRHPTAAEADPELPRTRRRLGRQSKPTSCAPPLFFLSRCRANLGDPGHWHVLGALGRLRRPLDRTRYRRPAQSTEQEQGSSRNWTLPVTAPKLETRCPSHDFPGSSPGRTLRIPLKPTPRI